MTIHPLVKQIVKQSELRQERLLVAFEMGKMRRTEYKRQLKAEKKLTITKLADVYDMNLPMRSMRRI